MELCGGLFIGAPESEVYKGSLESALRHQLPHEILDHDEINKRYPVLKPADGMLGLFEARAGFLHVERALALFHQRAREQGAALHFKTPIQAWSADRAGVILDTAAGRFHGDRLILATGAWSARWTGLPMVPERVVTHWLQPESDVGVFDSHRYPVNLWEFDNRRQLYSIPKVDGPMGGVKVAFHDIRHTTDPDKVDRQVGGDELAHLRGYLAPYIPDLNGRQLAAKVCLYTTTPDGHFIIGPHPQWERVLLACGFSGHGFKFAPVVGDMLCDLVCDRVAADETSLFDPQRPALYPKA